MNIMQHEYHDLRYFYIVWYVHVDIMLGVCVCVSCTMYVA